MTKGMLIALAALAVGLSFPAAGVTKATGGTLNMIGWEGYLQDQWVKPFQQQSGCTVLFSEDMQDRREIDGVRIVNPFV